MTYDKDIKENTIIVFIIPNKLYQEKLLLIIEDVASCCKRICYVTLNKPYTTQLRLFSQNKINPKQILFIDAITKGTRPVEASKQVIYVSSPRALVELNITVNKTVEVAKADAVVFDSLSTLLVYEKPMVITKFAHSIMSKLRTTNAKGIFTVLKEDVSKNLMKDLSMFADKIVAVEEEKSREREREKTQRLTQEEIDAALAKRKVKENKE